MDLQIGALYSRRDDIHRVFGGQRQGGISTPTESDAVLLFTGTSGEAHGYADFVDEEGFHLYGEGQSGDMRFTGGNKAIRDHYRNGKRLLLFQALGKSQPVRYQGEFTLIRTYNVRGPDGAGIIRDAIVFVLSRLEKDELEIDEQLTEPEAWKSIAIESTSTQAFVEVRTKQRLFRNRLLLIERSCRVTGITDLRFLRASHIRPWAACETGDERVDGNNGLLLAVHVDHLFDQGWISFTNDGELIQSPVAPRDVITAMGIERKIKKRPFTTAQRKYLKFHRSVVLRMG